jgi:hypothetical protein
MFFRAALAGSIVLGLAVSTYGQGVNPRAAAVPQIQLVPIQLTGTVAGVKPGMIAVTTPVGETWALSIPPKTEVRLTGTAEPDVLSPGMYVRFIAPVDKQRSLVQGKVAKLVIFSPSEETGRMPGVFYSGQEGDEAAAQPNPGMPPNLPEGRNAGLRPGPRRGRDPGVPAKAAPPDRNADAKDKAAANVETFDIRGRITAVKGRWLTVSARNTFFKPVLKIELADKPEISLDMNTYSLAKSGDKISARGVQVGAQAVQAMQMAIELGEPLGAAGRKPGRSLGKRSSRPSSKAGEDREPFEVAQEAEQGKLDEKKETAAQKEPGKPEPRDERGKQIVQYLQAKPEEIQGKPGVKLDLRDGDSATFMPCKQVSGKEVLGRFGLPDQVQKIKGSLPLGEGGKQKEVQWQLWIYGPVMFFVDEADTTRYLTVTVEKKKPPQPQQKKEKQEQPPQR